MALHNSVFISVKYNYDHVIERSLSAFLTQRGFVTYYHQGTVDSLRKGAISPFVSFGPMQVAIPTSLQNSSQRQIEPPQITSELINNLIEQICNHEIIVIVWSRPYAESFWAKLEMKAAILANKPILVIQTDDHDLCHDLLVGVKKSIYKFVEITVEYKTSQVVILIEDMLYNSNVREQSHKVIYKELEKFVARNYNSYKNRITFISERELFLYKTIVSRLYNSPDLYDQFEILDKSHQLTDDLRRYLELVISGELKAECPDWYYTYLLGEILGIRFLHPILPPKLRKLYEVNIQRALNPPSRDKVEKLIDDMIEECLFTREFVEYFKYYLEKLHDRVLPHIFWDLCTRRVGEAI